MKTCEKQKFLFVSFSYGFPLLCPTLTKVLHLHWMVEKNSFLTFVVVCTMKMTPVSIVCNCTLSPGFWDWKKIFYWKNKHFGQTQNKRTTRHFSSLSRGQCCEGGDNTLHHPPRPSWAATRWQRRQCCWQELTEIKVNIVFFLPTKCFKFFFVSPTVSVVRVYISQGCSWWVNWVMHWFLGKTHHLPDTCWQLVPFTTTYSIILFVYFFYLFRDSSILSLEMWEKLCLLCFFTWIYMCWAEPHALEIIFSVIFFTHQL